MPVGEFLTENRVLILRKIPSIAPLSVNLAPRLANPGANTFTNLSKEIRRKTLHQTTGIIGK